MWIQVSLSSIAPIYWTAFHKYWWRLSGSLSVLMCSIEKSSSSVLLISWYAQCPWHKVFRSWHYSLFTTDTFNCTLHRNCTPGLINCWRVVIYWIFGLLGSNKTSKVNKWSGLIFNTLSNAADHAHIHSFTNSAINHARWQPAGQEQTGGGNPQLEAARGSN